MNVVYYETELYHHGVKGMKWGHHKAVLSSGYAAARKGLRTAGTAGKAVVRTTGKAARTTGNIVRTTGKVARPIARTTGKVAINTGKKAVRVASSTGKHAGTVARGDAYDKAKKMNMVGASHRQIVKADKQMRKAQLKSARTDVKNVSRSRSLGSKVATNIMAGPFANRTYNSIRANGGSKAVAIGATAAATMLGGPIGHIAVSEIATRNLARNK